MEKSTLKTRLVLRNGTAAQWNEANPVLLKGEVGLENDTKRLKIGDGIAAWDELPYSDKEMRDLIEEATSSMNESIAGIRNMFKDGATLDEAKAALQALGENYKDVYSLASTLKSFLEATDTADTTINKWKEIEQFLSGISDTESLTTLLAELEARITEAYTTEIKNRIAERFENDIFILNGGTPEGW